MRACTATSKRTGVAVNGERSDNSFIEEGKEREKLQYQETSISHTSQFGASDVAAMRNFVEFLAELKEAQEEEWRKVGYDPQAPILGDRIKRGISSDTLEIYSAMHYTYYRDYPEGKYALDPQSFERLPGSHIWLEENCLDTILRLLTKMIEGVVKGRSSFQEGMNVLSTHECHQLFLKLSIYAGFYNFIPDYKDKEDKINVGGRDFPFEKSPQEEMTFCERVFSQIWIFPSLTEKQWGMLRNIARFRARDRLRSLYYKERKHHNDWSELVREEGVDLAYSFRYMGGSCFTYPKSFQLDEIDVCVNEVVAGEEQRLRMCIDKLCVPLTILAQQRAERKREVVARVTNVGSMLQSLCEILQMETSASQEEETTIVESNLSENVSEELFPVEIAGAVIILSKREAGLVVYADAKYKGKKVKVTTAHGLEAIAYIVRHIDDDFCAALFPRLPLQDRVTETVVVQCDKLKVGDDNKLTLFAGNVTEAFLEE